MGEIKIDFSYTENRHAGKTAEGTPERRQRGHAGETAERGYIMEKYKMDLHLFDEGATGGEGGAAAQGPEAGAQAEGGNPEGGRDLEAEFDSLIKGDYKDTYNKRVSGIVKDRLKGSKQTEASLREAREVMALMGERYGLDGTDAKALRAALENDKQYLEQEALEKGMSVEQLAEMKKMERENRSFRQAMERQREQAEFDQKFRAWSEEAEGLKEQYPTLNLMEEFNDPNFIRLLDSGVGVKAAYQAIHFDEIMSGAMAHTAQTAQKKVMDSVKANGARPQENAAQGAAGVSAYTDVNKLTKQQRKEIAEQVMRDPDKRITFR